MINISDLSTVDLETGKFRTENWRKYYADLIGQPLDPNSEDIFRGFKVPIEDLRGIIAIADANPGMNINAVRVYLAKEMDTLQANKDIGVLIVPVAGDLTSNGRDIVQLGNNSSTIYDFTTPCPEQCDVTSILYSSMATEAI